MSWRRRAACRATIGRWAGAALLAATAGSWAGVASLRDEAQLFSLLSAAPACCVIDARSDKARQADAMPGALQYRDGLRVKPTSHAVVLADSDDRALAVARKVARASPHAVYAAHGGLRAWRTVQARLQAQAAGPGSKFSFVIPHNTCEQGAPLHVFKAEAPAAAGSKAK